MNIQWFSKDLTGFATIYETNITLNTESSRFFTKAYKTIIGYDKENKLLFIKPLSKEDTMKGLFEESDLYDISIKPSYGRISNKRVVEKIVEVFPLDFTKQRFYKFASEWDEKNKLLKINLNKEAVV